MILLPVVKSCTVKSRIVTVEGKRGKVTKNFRHAPVEIAKVSFKGGDKSHKRKGDYIRLRKWFGRTGDAAACGTIKGILQSLMVGVTEVSNLHFLLALAQRVCV